MHLSFLFYPAIEQQRYSAQLQLMHPPAFLPFYTNSLSQINYVNSQSLFSTSSFSGKILSRPLSFSAPISASSPCLMSSTIASFVILNCFRKMLTFILRFMSNRFICKQHILILLHILSRMGSGIHPKNQTKPWATPIVPVFRLQRKK